MQPVGGAVIAAAGLGSRLGLGLPKCMLDIGGATILSRLIESLEPHVPRIHVVVGYREEMIMEHCAHHHRNVVLVRNPDYRSTNTAHSMSLGARGLTGRVVFMDGDLVISPASLGGFFAQAGTLPVLLGITRAKTDQAVFVETASTDDVGVTVTGFTRNSPKLYEWANILAGPPALVSRTDSFVFEMLRDMLPLPAYELDLYEVDTPADLERAEAFLSESP